VKKWQRILNLDCKFMVGCHKMGDILRKSGKWGILKILIGRSGRMVEIRKIPPESGNLAGMLM
jgi:hypothetical protein